MINDKQGSAAFEGIAGCCHGRASRTRLKKGDQISIWATKRLADRSRRELFDSWRLPLLPASRELLKRSLVGANLGVTVLPARSFSRELAEADISASRRRTAIPSSCAGLVAIDSDLGKLPLGLYVLTLFITPVFAVGLRASARQSPNTLIIFAAKYRGIGNHAYTCSLFLPTIADFRKLAQLLTKTRLAE